MKVFNHYILFVLILIFDNHTLANTNRNQSIRIDLFDYAPYSYLKENEIKGIFPEILKKSFAKVEMKTFFKIAPPARIQFNFLKGNLAIWPAELASIKDRVSLDELIMFNVVNAHASFSSLKSNKLPAPKLGNIKGKKIGHIRGFKKEFELYESKGASLSEANNIEQLIMMLLKGRVDYIGIEETSAFYYGKSLNVIDQLKIHPHVFEFPVGIIFNKKNKELAQKFKNGYDQLVKSGEYAEIIKKNTQSFYPHTRKLLIKEYTQFSNKIEKTLVSIP